MPAGANKTAKAAATREKIVDSALELFARDGFDKTTMRAIAEHSGMSLGSAYYYFRSKEDLMQGFYAQLFSSFWAKVEPALDGQSSLSDRLRVVLVTWVDNARPFHEFASGFFKFAADPSSPLSPFSPESKETREAAIAIYRTVIDGSNTKIAGSLNEQMPEMLWLYQMGIVMFWAFDSSNDQTKTIQLIERTVPLVARLIALARVPGFKSVATDITRLFADLRSNER